MVTPYHAQVMKIRAVLRAFADEVKVASVEEFQGQVRIKLSPPDKPMLRLAPRCLGT